MGFDSVPHRLRVNDVVPAEGVQKVIDVANGNRVAFYEQHDPVDATHVDVPFLIARVHIKLLSELRIAIVSHAGPIARTFRDENWIGEAAGTNVTIDMASNVEVLGANACVQYANAAVTLTGVVPTIIIEKPRRIHVQFKAQLLYLDVPYVHVMIRGLRTG